MGNFHETEAEAFFGRAAGFDEGHAIFKDFESRKQADSFRTSLYKVRKIKRDFTVLISVEGSRVTAKKASTTAKYGTIAPDGTVGEVVIETALERAKKEFEQEKEEILRNAEKYGWSDTLTNDSIEAAKDTIYSFYLIKEEQGSGSKGEEAKASKKEGN